MTKKILWIIPARSGSKSIPSKNIKLLGGIPLFVYRFLAVSKSRFPNDIWLSTDSQEYCDIAKGHGIDAPFIRPQELSTDQANSVDVVLHAMQFAIHNNLQYNFVGLLEPTSPFIKIADIDAAIEKLERDTDAHGVVAVKQHRPASIFVQKAAPYLNEFCTNIKDIKKMGRQEFEKEITPSGGFYICRWDRFLQEKTFYADKTIAYEVDEISGLEIDEPLDWEFAEFILEKKRTP